MASGQSVFKGAFGWDDSSWWAAISCVALLILLLLVCCCVCTQRAKRKGHEEALASVQAHQRLTQERERAERQQRQRYQHAQHVQQQYGNNGIANAYQPPGLAYPNPVAVPLAPPPNRKSMGPQVAANGFRENPSQLHNQQFAKPYPPLPALAEAQSPQEADHMTAQYQAPSKWFSAGERRSTVSNGFGANAPRVSSGSFATEPRTSTQYPDSMRYEDPYATAGGPNSVPFTSVTSPSASESLKANRNRGVKLQNQRGSNVLEQIPAPVVVPRCTQAPPSPSEARASSRLSTRTLQSRIDELRSADSNAMAHSRISVSPESSDSSTASRQSGAFMGTIEMPRASTVRDSYMSVSSRRSGLTVGSVLSPHSSAFSSALSESGRSFETFDAEVLESSESPELGAVLTHGSSRSIGSDYCHGQFEDAESFGPEGLDTSNERATMPCRSKREDNASFTSSGSVEF